MMCLTYHCGVFVQVGYTNNYFAWNPQARTFTVCLCIQSAADSQTAGVLSLNCEMVDPQVST
jgi:hypothetical protein